MLKIEKAPLSLVVLCLVAFLLYISSLSSHSVLWNVISGVTVACSCAAALMSAGERR